MSASDYEIFKIDDSYLSKKFYIISLSKDLTQKAVKMLLAGATLLSEPCPYCKGVRVMKDGHALCVNCGKEPEIKNEVKSKIENGQKLDESPLQIFEQKLQSLSQDLSREKDHKKQQEILKSINSLIETIQRLKNSQ